MRLITKTSLVSASLAALSGCVAVPVGPEYYAPAPAYSAPAAAYYAPAPAYYAPPAYYGPSFSVGVYRGWRGGRRYWR